MFEILLTVGRGMFEILVTVGRGMFGEGRGGRSLSAPSSEPPSCHGVSFTIFTHLPVLGCSNKCHPLAFQTPDIYSTSISELRVAKG